MGGASPQKAANLTDERHCLRPDSLFPTYHFGVRISAYEGDVRPQGKN